MFLHFHRGKNTAGGVFTQKNGDKNGVILIVFLLIALPCSNETRLAAAAFFSSAYRFFTKPV
jgi:hypothetical protein